MRSILIVIGFAVLVSCGGASKPADLIPKEKMELVLTDLLLAESFAESYRSVDTTRKMPQLYGEELDRVIAIHKITQKQLLESVDYYKTQPELFKTIMDSVAARSNREKDKVFKEAMEKPKK